MQIVPIHHQHAKNKRPWILLPVVSGPWTSFVAALDKGQFNIAVCRRYIYYFWYAVAGGPAVTGFLLLRVFLLLLSFLLILVSLL